MAMQAVQRLQKDYKALLKDPVPFITAKPLSNNILEWHYVLEGQDDTPYEGGYYHGKIIFPPQYPFKPPSILMLTPSGRFAVNTRLCLSMSDYHPESWNPVWSVSCILTGLMSFFYEDTPTTGSVTTSKADKQRLAAQSYDHNAATPVFVKLFPEILETHRAKRERLLAARPPPPAQGDGPGAAPPGEVGAGGGDRRQQQQAAAGDVWLRRLGTVAMLCGVVAILAVPLFSLDLPSAVESGAAAS